MSRRPPKVSTVARSGNLPPVKLDTIRRVVAARYGISVAEMIGPRRLRLFARPRHIAMYLARYYTANSLPKIGQLFGGRDHTTVLHAFRRVHERAQRFAMLEIELNSIERVLLAAAEQERETYGPPPAPKTTDFDLRKAA